jgi:anhydro-N-acetylmuramic acid kinase
MRVLGLMSGTSADGVDGVLVRLQGAPRRPRWRILASAHVPYPDELRAEIVSVGQGSSRSAAAMLELAEAITEVQAACARRADPAGSARLVGCHGQTLWHRPPESIRRGASWQVLQGPLLAELLATPVVCDFRGADLARGGQGAPLVPLCDGALLPAIGGWRALLNLGGIANLTLLPPRQGPDQRAPIRGWDCGPANTLLDLAVQRFSQGRLRFDADGAWAARGHGNDEAIARWLQEPYLQQPPPKSTGRELFGAVDLERRLEELGPVDPADALATLTAFTAAVVAADLERGPRPLELLVAGGGCRNATLMGELRRRCRGVVVRPLADLGIADLDREALAFALLAWWHWRGVAAADPAVTGCRRGGRLGVLIRP